MQTTFTLTITISPDGETVEGEVKGIKGKRCGDVAKLLDQIGEEVEHRHTAEWHEPEPVRLSRSTTGTLHIGGT